MYFLIDKSKASVKYALWNIFSWIGFNRPSFTVIMNHCFGQTFFIIGIRWKTVIDKGHDLIHIKIDIWYIFCWEIGTHDRIID